MAQIHDPLVFGGYESDGQEEVAINDVEDVPLDTDVLGALPSPKSPDASAVIPTEELPLADPITTSSNGPTLSDAGATYGQLLPDSFQESTWHTAGTAHSPEANGDAARHDAGAISSTPSGLEAGASTSASPSKTPPPIQPVAGALQLDMLVVQSRSSSKQHLEVTVSDPVKKIEQSVIPGMSGGYVTYKVSTKSSLPGYANPEVSVRRRFKDFVALADLLAATHRGYFIPPRPDKHPIEAQRASAEFVELRRQLLEKYLLKLTEHPIICRSDELRVFLETEGPLSSNYQWQQLVPLHHSTLEGLARLPKQVFGQDRAIPAPSEAAQSTKRTGDLFRRFKELGTSIKGDYKKSATVSLDEGTLQGDTQMVEDYQEMLAAASRKAEKFIKRLEDYGNVLGDLGLSLVKVAKFEDEDGSKMGAYTDAGQAAKQLSADTRRVGMAALRLSRVNRHAVSQDAVALSVLHDHLALTPSILKALKEREEQLLTVSSLQDELEKKKKGVSALEEEGSKVFGGDKAKTRKVQNLQNDVAALEAALVSAESEYDKIKDRNKEELHRWKGTRSSDVALMLQQFSRVELLFSERGRTVWMGVAEEFGAGHGLDKQAVGH